MPQDADLSCACGRMTLKSATTDFGVLHANQRIGMALLEDMDAEAPGLDGGPAPPSRPSREAALDAVKTLIAYTGDDPQREGLLETPDRVVRSLDDFYSGYFEDPIAILQRTFEETEGYDEMVVLRDVSFVSHCEHHMVPILGRAHVAYLPERRVVGISKLARVVEIYAKRLQIQERLTAQVAGAIDGVLRPRGVGVIVEATHQCMATRGVKQPGVTMTTSKLLGVFREDAQHRLELLARIGRC